MGVSPGREPTARVVRVAVLGDVHAEDERLERALDAALCAEVEAILCVGDIVDGEGDADRTCALLAERGVLSVRGNHDRWLLAGEMRALPSITVDLGEAARAYLSELPTTRRFATPRGDLLLCHGLGDDDMLELRPDTRGYGLQVLKPELDRLREDEIRFVACGHTHRPMVRSLFGVTVINAGTLHRKHAPSFTVIDFDRGIVEQRPLDETLPVVTPLD